MSITIPIKICEVGYSIPCIICDESIELTKNEVLSLQYGHSIHSKVCDKCKQAILHIRKDMGI